MFQYSGPNSQQVLDKYSFDWEQYLAANGIITVCVDGRGTGARGEAFRKCTYLRMGELESKDQVEAAQALGKLPFVDKSRMAIWGWSFGGYNTLMAMSVGNGTFKAGITILSIRNVSCVRQKKILKGMPLLHRSVWRRICRGSCC